MRFNSLEQVYALEIQMYTAQKNNKKLKALYDQSLHIKSAIPHPLILGVIRFMSNIYAHSWINYISRECGGKMHLREGEFEKAHTDFFEVRCLVLTNSMQSLILTPLLYLARCLVRWN